MFWFVRSTLFEHQYVAKEEVSYVVYTVHVAEEDMLMDSVAPSQTQHMCSTRDKL